MQGAVRPLIAESWQRSARAGAGVDAARLPATRVPGGDLDAFRSARPLAPLVPLFRDLLGEVARDGGFIFALGDADGTLLWVEGERAARAAAERMNFAPGALWSEAQAGTNAPGTALAVGRPVQVVGVEHFNAAAHRWSCSAAPVRDRDGRTLGVVDITGDELRTAPHALALVRAVATAAEAELARRGVAADERALRRYLDLTGTSMPAALLAGSGRIIHAAGLDRSALAGLARVAPGPLVLPDGRRAVAEPIDDAGHVLVRLDVRAGSATDRSPIQLTALGRDCAVLTVDGHTHRLSHRHSEIVVALSLLAGGASAGRLVTALSDAEIPPVTMRVEMSRLRALLGPDVVGSRPYELRRPVCSDLADVRDLLAAGRVAEALAGYRGPLLPRSDAPVIVEARDAVEQQLRGAVLASRDPALLRRWVDAPWGAEDASAWRALADNLPGGSAQRAAAAGRARALFTRGT